MSDVEKLRQQTIQNVSKVITPRLLTVMGVFLPVSNIVFSLQSKYILSIKEKSIFIKSERMVL